jgi:hypothetical protein
MITGRDRDQVRRAALALADNGLVDARQDDAGFSFYPIGTARDRNQIIDAPFRIVSEPPPSPAARPAYGGQVIHRLPVPAPTKRGRPLHPASARCRIMGCAAFRCAVRFRI